MPQTEESLGFEPGWRDVLRAQLACLKSEAETKVVDVGGESGVPDPSIGLSPEKNSRESTTSEDFFTPQAPSPPQMNRHPEKPLPVEHLMFLDEAIVSMVSTYGGGCGT